MSYSEFLTKSNILLANGSLNKNYKKIYDKMSSDDKLVIDSSFHEYDDISYKIKMAAAIFPARFVAAVPKIRKAGTTWTYTEF